MDEGFVTLFIVIIIRTTNTAPPLKCFVSPGLGPGRDDVVDTAEDRNFLPPQLYAGQPPYMVPHFMRLTDKQKVQKDINYVVARTHSSRC